MQCRLPALHINKPPHHLRNRSDSVPRPNSLSRTGKTEVDTWFNIHHLHNSCGQLFVYVLTAWWDSDCRSDKWLILTAKSHLDWTVHTMFSLRHNSLTLSGFPNGWPLVSIHEHHAGGSLEMKTGWDKTTGSSNISGMSATIFSITFYWDQFLQAQLVTSA